MTFRVDEFGKRLIGSTGFDMSGNTSMSFEIIKPDNTTYSWTATLGTVTENGLTADQWAYYDTINGDLDQAGVWKVEFVYIDATSQFISDCTSFTVDERCE